jgi:hypothetical protein
MQRAKKEQQKQKKLQELRSALANQVFTNEYSTVRVCSVNFIDGHYLIKWMFYELTSDAIYAHELRQWIAFQFKIRYYDIELTSS